MYLKCHYRFKNGKDHRYWSLVESVRTRRGVIKRQLLYLGLMFPLFTPIISP